MAERPIPDWQLLPGSSGQMIRVRFNADTNPGLPWTFAPDQGEVTLNLGDEQIAFYHATNHVRPVCDRYGTV